MREVARGTFTSAWRHFDQDAPWYSLTLDQATYGGGELYYFEEYGGAVKPAACSGDKVVSGQDAPVVPYIGVGITQGDLTENEETVAIAAFGHRVDPNSSFDYLSYGAKMKEVYSPASTPKQHAKAIEANIVDHLNFTTLDGFGFIYNAMLLGYVQEFGDSE